MKKTGLLILVLLLLHSAAFADGKFYIEPIERNYPPPGIPGQRAVIAHDGKKQLMILQSQFDGYAENFGWVVPLPSVPELASLPGPEAEILFEQLNIKTAPTVVRFSEFMPVLWLLLLILVVAGAISLLVYKIIKRKAPPFISILVRSFLMIVISFAAVVMLYENQSETLYFFFTAFCFALLLALWTGKAVIFLLKKSIPDYITIISGTLSGVLILFTVIPLFLLFTNLGGPVYGLDDRLASDGIEVLKEEQVGVYDVKVIRAEKSDVLLEWFKKNGFVFDDSDKRAFDDYIKRNWCFVTSRISLERLERSNDYWTGYVMPLAVLFPAEKPVYPLMLTGTADGITDVLLYVFSKNKVEDHSGRFTLKYASPVRLPLLFDKMPFEPSAFAEKCIFETGFLTRLQASLSSEGMREDLFLEKAPDNSKYRETYYFWW